MKKRLLFIPLMALLTSCHPYKPLYNWEDYGKTSYDYFKKQTPESEEALFQSYQKMVNGTSKNHPKVAPGVYCEYGYMLIQKGYPKQALEMFNKEKQIYPQSAVFMNYLIKHFSE